MNEETIKKIIQESEVVTSPDFTDKLITRIELEGESTQKVPRWNYKKTFFILVLIMAVILATVYLLQVGGTSTRANSTVLPLVGLAFIFLYTINHLLLLKGNYKKLTM